MSARWLPVFTLVACVPDEPSAAGCDSASFTETALSGVDDTRQGVDPAALVAASEGTYALSGVWGNASGRAGDAGAATLVLRYVDPVFRYYARTAADPTCGADFLVSQVVVDLSADDGLLDESLPAVISVDVLEDGQLDGPVRVSAWTFVAELSGTYEAAGAAAAFGDPELHLALDIEDGASGALSVIGDDTSGFPARTELLCWGAEQERCAVR